jgi:glutathione S-transferase
LLRLHDYLESGNGYKVRLLLHQQGRPFEWIEHDILRGETRTPEYLALNPNGKIPLLELEDGTCLAESNAIQWYLAEGTPFLPEDRLLRAQVLQWLFFEQYSHEPYIAVVRFWTHAGTLDDHAAELATRRASGHAALAVMEHHLAERSWFVGDAYSIADIALYAYTHVAPEGGFDLAPYPSVGRWLDRVRSAPKHIPISKDRPRF